MRRRWRVLSLAGILLALVAGTAEGLPQGQSPACSVPLPADRCVPNEVDLPDPSAYYGRVDMAWIPQPQNLFESHVLDYARRMPPLLWEACESTDNTGKGQGYLTHVVAEAGLLRLIEDPRGREAVSSAFSGHPAIHGLGADYQQCLDKMASGWRIPGPVTTTPGWTKVIADLEQVPALSGKPGTDSIPTCRTGGGDQDDWDMTMILVIRAWGLMKDEPNTVLFGVDDQSRKTRLAMDVAQRAWLEGSAADQDATVCTRLGIAVPETENHEWMIRTTRFLHNELLPMNIFPPRGEIGDYVRRYDIDQNSDNTSNGILGYIRGITFGVLDHDWLEYNARPYGNYQIIGLLNLYDFSTEPTVRAMAGAVLDFMSMKQLSESMSGERIAPFRRLAEKDSPDLYVDDTMGTTMEEWTGGLAEPVFPKAGAGGVSGEMAIAAMTAYRPPSWMIDLAFNPQHRDYWAYFSGRGQQEAAYGGPDYTLAGGGRTTGCPYPVTILDLCVGSGNDPGTAEPIVLMPHQARQPQADPGQETDYPTYGNNIIVQQAGENDCVAANFACGTITVPDSLANSRCALKTSDGRFTDTALIMDEQCLGPASHNDCLFVFVSHADFGDIAKPLPGFDYLVTHSCHASDPTSVTNTAYQHFVQYMQSGSARPSLHDVFPCLLSWVGSVDITLPPPNPVDIAGAPDSSRVKMSPGKKCGIPAWELFYPDDGNIRGDLTLSGGNYPPTALAVVSKPNCQQPVQFTATVTAKPAHSSPLPAVTGTVTFVEGATTLGTLPVTATATGATATLTLSNLPVGVHYLTAYYSGDATYVPSVVDITQTVL